MPAVREHTFLPPRTERELQAISSAVASSETAELRSADGTVTPIPDEVYAVLRDVLSMLGEGKAIAVTPLHTELTTQEAAGLLGISRPTLIKKLDQGEIPHTRPSRHRRLRLTDVLEYRSSLREQRRDALREMVEISEQAGLYDLDDEQFEEAERALKARER